MSFSRFKSKSTGIMRRTIQTDLIILRKSSVSLYLDIFDLLKNKYMYNASDYY